MFSSKHFQYSSRAPQQACLSFIDGAAIPSGLKLSTKICDINKGLIIPQKASQRKRYCHSLRPPLFKALPPDFNDASTTNQFYRNVIIRALAAATAKSLQSCPILCDPTDDSPPGSPVPGILQARTLEWVAISFSNACRGSLSLTPCNCSAADVAAWSERAAVRFLAPTWSVP